MTGRGTVQSVAVTGGRVTFEVHDGTTEPVLCIHGISSQRLLWNWLRAEDPGLTLVAPDLRGRADSYEVEGPFDLEHHSLDMVAVLDALELDAVHVCGMSMGGFVAVDLAHRHPGRVKSLILVDGGFPMLTPPGLTAEAVPGLFADRLGRLDRKWESVDEYAAYFTDSTAPLLDRDDRLLRDYLEHDLRDGLVRLSKDALVGDAASIFFGDNPWASIEQPVRLLYAEWSSGRDTPPAYGPGRVEQFLAHTVDSKLLTGTDHAGTIMTRASAREVAAMIRAALAGRPGKPVRGRRSL